MRFQPFTGVAVAIVLVLTVQVDQAFAKRNFNANCSGCHNSARAVGDIINHDGLDNPAGSTALKHYEVAPGDTIGLDFNITNNYGNKYAIALQGVKNIPGSTPDSGWTAYGSGSWYASPYYNTTGLHTFNLGIDPTTPTGYYLMEVQFAGGNEVWHDKEQFYVQVLSLITPGDFNGDGSVEAADLALLLDNWGYGEQGNASYPAPANWTGSWDGFVDANELAGLLDNWGSGLGAAEPLDINAVMAAIPEPGVMLALTILCASAVRRRRSQR